MEYIKLNHPRDGVTVESSSVYSYPTHMHSYFEMTLYEPFAGRISLNDRDFFIDVPTCVLVAPSDFHRITVDEGSGSARYIKLGFARGALQESNVPASSAVLRLPTDCFLHSLYEELLRSDCSEAYRAALVNAATRIMIEQGEAVLPVALHASYRLATDAVRLINERFSEQMNEGDLAAMLSVSPQYLSRMFSKTVGMGFSAYLTEVRLRRAAKLLLETDMGITQICYACGYGSLSHFLRSFKAKYGVTPAQYRAKA